MTTDAAASADVDQGSRSGLARALRVLRLISDRTPETLGVSTIARELDLPKAVVHRIVKEFTAAGFLSFDEQTKHYRLGRTAITMGLTALRVIDVPRIAHPFLEQIVRRTAETATLSVRHGWSRVYVDQVLSPHEIRMSIQLGSSHPLHAGSSSKVILAHLDDDEIDRFFEDNQALAPLTSATITDAAELRAELAQIRAVGHATSRGERQAGAGSVAAPIRRVTGDVFGAISLCGPLDRFAAAGDTAELLCETADRISAELGYRSPEEWS